MSHDVFLSYSSKDKLGRRRRLRRARAQRRSRLDGPARYFAGNGMGRVNHQRHAQRARRGVPVFSGNANEFKQVRSEVERAINIGIPVIPFRIEDIEPRGSLELFLGAAHRLDAFTKPVEQHLDRLADVVRRVIEAQYGEADADRPPREKEEPEQLPRAAADEERRKAAAAREEEREQARAVTGQARAELASVPPPRLKTGLLAASVLAAMLALGGGWYAFAPKPIVDTEQAEFDAAMQTGTIPALEAFLAKYPTGPLPNTARRERERLKAARAAGEGDRKEQAVRSDQQGQENATSRKSEADEIRQKADEAFEAKNYADALTWYQKAGDQDAFAQFRLGWLYQYGNGVAQDYTQAMLWYRKAADQGYAGSPRAIRRLVSTTTARACRRTTPRP